MANKTKKIDRDFLYTDSSLNSYGYRLLTSGYLMDEFQKNPIGFKMHLRDEGVVVRWEDFRKEGDKVYARPVVNLAHPKGQQVVDEIENGFLNAASVGHIVVLEISKNPSDYLPNQKGPTVSKWFHRELSLVDYGGNYNALADLFDNDGNPMNLADFAAPTIQTEIMQQLFLTPDQIKLLPNLKADPTAEDVTTALQNLVAEAAKVPDLSARLQTAEQAKEKAETDLASLKKTTVATQVADLLDNALNKDKKITAALKAKLEKQYAENPEGLKDLLADMPGIPTITENLKGSGNAPDLADKSWQELDKAGQLPDLKANDFELFKTKYKEEFKKDYTGA